MYVCVYFMYVCLHAYMHVCMHPGMCVYAYMFCVLFTHSGYINTNVQSDHGITGERDIGAERYLLTE